MVPGLRSLIAAGLLTATTLFPTAVPAAAAATQPPIRAHVRAADPPQPQSTDGLPADGRLPVRGSGRPQPSVEDQTGTGATGHRPQDPDTSVPAGTPAAPTEPDDSPSPSSTASGPSPSADASESATASPGRPTPSHSASGSGGPTSRPATPPRTAAATPPRTDGTSASDTPHASGTSDSAGTPLKDPGATGRPATGDHSERPYAPLSPHGRGTHEWQTLRPPHNPAAAGPSSTSRETTGAVRPPYAPTERAARVARVLPFGAGLALTGLGLAFIGLRLRRR